MPDALWPELLEAQQLTDVDPGAVAAAAERVRSYVGWHLAPSFTETVEVEGAGVWVLPTRRVISVNTITDVTSSLVLLLTDYRIEHGIIRAKWSRVRRRLAINLTHGYDTCPRDVVEFVRQLARAGNPMQRATQESIGQTSVSYREPDFAALDQYALPRIA